MPIRDPLPTIFKTAGQFLSLRVLYDIAPNGITGRQVSKISRSTPMTTHKALLSLVDSGLVKYQSVPPAKLYSLNEDYLYFDVLKAFFAEINKNSSLTTLGQKLNDKCSHSLISIILFGSFARKEEDLDSDLALLFITKTKEPTIEYISEFQNIADNISGENTQVMFSTVKKFHAGIKRKSGFLASIPVDGISIYGKTVVDLVNGW